jgi:uncharacterized protein (DUF1697 family)
MKVHIVLLRAVNVGGSTTLSMARLKAMIQELGFEAETLLQSGNVVLGNTNRDGEALEKLLEAETARRLGLKTDFLVRTAREWDAMIKANPFTKEAEDDPAHLVAMALKQAAKAADVKALEAAIRGRERVVAKGRQLYVVYPDGIGRSKLTIGVIEKALGTRATGRNWNTVLKLAALAERSGRV